MTKICNLPRDLAEEVLSRVPLTSLRRVRSTCRKWNTLSKDMSFAKKHLAQAKVAAAERKCITVVMMMYFRVHLMRFSLSTTNNNNNVEESCIKPEAKLIGPDGSDEMDVSEVFHCDGLLLCVRKDNPRLIVWNPYWGQTRWIEPAHSLNSLYRYVYALGYDKSSNSHKILAFSEPYPSFTAPITFKIYEFNSDSWRVLDVPPPDWRIEYHNRGLSLKGNTYWFVEKYVGEFLVCFDFTRETFGPRLPLPAMPWWRKDTVSLSSVRDEQLAVLLQSRDIFQIEIWITTKIEPDAVSWSNKVFLSANLIPLIHPQWELQIATGFFIDEEKKIAVVFNKGMDLQNIITRNVAYIIEVDGSVKEAYARESAKAHCNAIVCSYVPSLVQLN